MPIAPATRGALENHMLIPGQLTMEHFSKLELLRRLLQERIIGSVTTLEVVTYEIIGMVTQQIHGLPTQIMIFGIRRCAHIMETGNSSVFKQQVGTIRSARGKFLAQELHRFQMVNFLSALDRRFCGNRRDSSSSEEPWRYFHGSQ